MAIDKDAVAALGERTLGPEYKALPPTAWGLTVREFLATAPHLDEFETPVLTVDRAAVDSNIEVMADWARAAGVELAPHGKTSMSPQLWADQLAAGSWAITLATGWQVQVARSFGVGRILLANALVDPVALHWLAAELAKDPEFEFLSWVDSVATVELMDRHLSTAPGTEKVTVLIELGGANGRTGARSVEAAHEIAAAVGRSERLRLGGVGGYEAALAHDRTPESLATVRGYLDELARLHREIVAAGGYSGSAVVTAGGSAYPELMVERLAGLAGEGGVPTTVVLRSGAYVTHDDGFYAGISPLTAAYTERPLRSAIHGWARAVSRPEPELALLDAGKRDLPFDEGLPVPQQTVGPAVRELPSGAWVSKLNDQHTFLRLPGGDAADVPVGSVVRLGISHPCTAFDKWRLIPVIDDADAERPRVIDLLHTFF